MTLFLVVISLPPFLAAQGTDENHYSDHFYFRKASVEVAEWVIILPGASGLKFFDDEHHYFEVAKALNESFNVLYS